jgi:hypothetical protein
MSNVKSKLNAPWHEKNPMPKNATLEQRIKWHVAHADKCGCREMPISIKTALAERAGSTSIKGAAVIKKFSAVLQDAGGGGVYVNVPFDVEKVYGTKGQVKINATFEGVPYRGIISNMGTGGHCLIVLKSIRAKIGKQVGDNIKIELQRDTEARVVVVPPDFQKALNKNKAARAFFDKSSYTCRKEYVRWIEEAKRAETRLARIEKAVERLANNERFS